MRQILIGLAMIGATLAIVYAGKARAQEGQAVFMTGFLCDSPERAQAFIEKLKPDTTIEEATKMTEGSGCSVQQAAGFIKSETSWTSTTGDTFAIVAVSVEDKTLYTWRLTQSATAL